MNRKYQDSRGREWYALHVRTGEERDVAMDVYALGDADSLLRILGDPYEAIPEEQMAAVMALYWHGVNGTQVVRTGGVTQVVGGALVEVAHDVTCADERQGVITVALDLPGGTREITMHAEFIKPGVYEKHEEQAGVENGGLRIPHGGSSE